MPLPADLELRLVNTIDDCYDMKRWLGERRDVLGLDTETTGLDPHAPGANLRLVQIGDHRAGWAVPWEQWGGAVLECLNAWDGPLTLHNAAFDARWLKIHANWDMPWHRTHDTMIMSQMMLPGQPAGLKPLTQKYIDRKATVGETLLKDAMAKEGWGWHNIPIEYDAYWGYSALDPVLAAHLWTHFRADQVYPESYDLEMAARRICSTMEQNGVRIDVDYCQRTRDELDQKVEMGKKWALDTIGINIGSTVQLIKYFTENLGAEIERTTPSGKPSLDKEQLAIFAASENEYIRRFADFILSVRKADKLRGTYFDNFLKMHNDGVLHPSIRTLQAVTGRMSITDPALQTLGKGDSTVRSAFIGREPGHKIISSDLDQVEFRMFAHLSGDASLCETFNRADATGSDAFTEIGREIYQDPQMAKSDKRRGLVKNVIYGKLYGASVRKQALTAKVPYEQMKAVSDALEGRYPGMKKFQQSMDDMVVRRQREEGKGYITTAVTGRRIPVDDDRAYTGVNYTIQSSAAEIFKRNLMRLDQAGLTDYLMVPVHDEIVMSVPEDIVEDVMRVTQECMTTTEGWSVPLTSGVDGPYDNWGAKYE